VDGRLVRERHDAEDAAVQLRYLCPEPYPLAVGLSLNAHGLLDDPDAHLSSDVWTLGEHLALEVCREGEVHAFERSARLMRRLRVTWPPSGDVDKVGQWTKRAGLGVAWGARPSGLPAANVG